MERDDTFVLVHTMKITTTTSTTSTIRGACSAFVRVLFATVLLLTPVFAAAQTSTPTITAMAAGAYLAAAAALLAGRLRRSRC